MKPPYDVGYGKPPKANQFKPGQSGNPAGRKKGSKNLSTLLRDALEVQVTVTENGRTRRMSKLQAAFTQLTNRAAGGDAKAIKMAVDILLATETREAAKANGEALTPEARRQNTALILSSLRDRLKSEDTDVGQD
jgi:hypothetical protein